ncbi:hypothetical protein [Haloarchaeobius sp. DFWS5]|uniref:hypothetical protein n=1 Tax=Haloarchaeobius sp. DFWS5 TaxID=3446114 RepID=UPI003EBBB618
MASSEREPPVGVADAGHAEYRDVSDGEELVVYDRENEDGWVRSDTSVADMEFGTDERRKRA